MLIFWKNFVFPEKNLLKNPSQKLLCKVFGKRFGETFFSKKVSPKKCFLCVLCDLCVEKITCP